MVFLLNLLLTYQTLLIFLAVVPGIYLMYQVYKLDRTDREPVGLISLLLLAGAVTTYVAMILEMIGARILSAFVQEGTVLYAAIEYFVVVACAEEGVKYLALKNLTWKHPAFDHRFDGIIYAVAVGLGFAMLENVNYVFQYGVSTAVVRAVTAVPAHTIFAIFMGHFYGQAKYCKAKGKDVRCRINLMMAYLLPVVMHGTYDFFASNGSTEALVIFIAMVVITDIIAVGKVKKYAQNDARI